MAFLSAYLGVAGLADIGYQFRNPDETANGSRITTGITDSGDGWYSTNAATIPGTAISVRWDSTGTTEAKAREYFYDYADEPGVTTLLSRIPSALTITSGAVNVNDKTGFALTSAYDAAKTAAAPGAAMTLTSAYDAAKTASSQASNDQIYTALDTEVAAIKSQTDKLQFAVGNDLKVTLDGEQVALTISAMSDVADALLKRDFTAISGEAAYSLLNAARMLRNSWSSATGSLVVKKEDGSTTAWSRALTTDVSAAPITGAT